jgi:hypothetical protein
LRRLFRSIEDGIVELDDTLQGPARSADRTGSPAAVSEKREYLKVLPDTFDDFGL